MRKNRFLYALALSPLLLGAGTAVNQLTVTTALPKCGDKEYLTYKGGALGCTEVNTSGTLSLKDCNTSGQLLSSLKNGDIATLGCINKGTGGTTAADVMRVTTIKNTLIQIGTDITNIEKNPPPAASLFVGVTPAKYKARFEHGTNNPGIESAAALCADTYGAGARMCNVNDIYGSVVAGKFKYDGTGNVPKAWIWASSLNAPGSSIAAPVNPTEGYSDTCADGLYNTHDQGWSGVVFEWTVVRTGNYGPKFHNGKAIDCNLDFPIACCK